MTDLWNFMPDEAQPRPTTMRNEKFRTIAASESDDSGKYYVHIGDESGRGSVGPWGPYETEEEAEDAKSSISSKWGAPGGFVVKKHASRISSWEESITATASGEQTVWTRSYDLFDVKISSSQRSVNTHDGYIVSARWKQNGQKLGQAGAEIAEGDVYSSLMEAIAAVEDLMIGYGATPIDSGHQMNMKTANEGPSEDSQSGFAESEVEWVTVDGATETFEMGWTQDDLPESYEMADEEEVGPFQSSYRHRHFTSVKGSPMSPRRSSRRTAVRRVHIKDVQPGDVLVDGPDAEPRPQTDTVAYVDGFNGMWIIDFTDGTSTPPLGNGMVYVASRRTAAPEGWWGTSPSKRNPGEEALICPSCGSQNVIISGSNLGSDVVRGNNYSSLECRDCGNKQVFRKNSSRKTASGDLVYEWRSSDGKLVALDNRPESGPEEEWYPDFPGQREPIFLIIVDRNGRKIDSLNVYPNGGWSGFDAVADEMDRKGYEYVGELLPGRSLSSEELAKPFFANKTAGKVQFDPEDHSHSWWNCERCGTEIHRYRGQGDQTCPKCGANYNAFGQRLRDDLYSRPNMSEWDDEIGDMEGYEMAMNRYEGSRKTAAGNAGFTVVYNPQLDGDRYLLPAIVEQGDRIQLILSESYVEELPVRTIDDAVAFMWQRTGERGIENFTLYVYGDVKEYGGARMASRKTASRPLYEIHDEIRRDWRDVNFAAAPYLDAMRYLESMSDRYGADEARWIVAYFLENAKSWRGETAKRIKSELRSMMKSASRKTAASRMVVCNSCGHEFVATNSFKVFCPNCGSDNINNASAGRDKGNFRGDVKKGPDGKYRARASRKTAASPRSTPSEDEIKEHMNSLMKSMNYDDRLAELEDFIEDNTDSSNIDDDAAYESWLSGQVKKYKKYATRTDSKVARLFLTEDDRASLGRIPAGTPVVIEQRMGSHSIVSSAHNGQVIGLVSNASLRRAAEYGYEADPKGNKPAGAAPQVPTLGLDSGSINEPGEWVTDSQVGEAMTRKVKDCPNNGTGPCAMSHVCGSRSRRANRKTSRTWSETVSVGDIFSDYSNGSISFDEMKSRFADRIDNSGFSAKYESIISDIRYAESEEEFDEILEGLYDEADVDGLFIDSFGSYS